MFFTVFLEFTEFAESARSSESIYGRIGALEERPKSGQKNLIKGKSFAQISQLSI